MSAEMQNGRRTVVALGRLLSRVRQMYEDWPTDDKEIEKDIALAQDAIEAEARRQSWRELKRRTRRKP